MTNYENLRYARAYILLQKYRNLYPINEGFCKGTIFADLYRPYKKEKNANDYRC
ncbi:MAG: spore coat associated protein CotJA [Clostridium butyricum]|nr:spore coat associated protein CotJA [Clostridium butyricum]